jgi:hypothetical protein
MCPIKGQVWSLHRTGTGSQFTSLSLGTTKTPPHCQMLVIHPAFYYYYYYILPREPQEWLRCHKPLNRTFSCDLVDDFISLYPSMSRDPVQPHSVPGTDTMQCLLALSYQWRCCGSLKGFQSSLTIRTNTYFSGLTFV